MTILSKPTTIHGLRTDRGGLVASIILVSSLFLAGTTSCSGYKGSGKVVDDDRVDVLFSNYLPNDCVVHVHAGGTLAFGEEDEDVATIVGLILVGGYEGRHEFSVRVEEPDRTAVADLFRILGEFRQQLKQRLPEDSRAVIYVAGPHLVLDADTNE